MLPIIAETILEVRQAVAQARHQGKRVGLVPTMGALHAGHASLIDTAHRENGFTVVTIFVNPTQFGPNEDLDRYPRTLPADRALCGQVGADLLFVPQPTEMYPPGFCTWVEVKGLDEHLCGPTRPGHFRGVCTVVLKLFQIVQADVAYFGQKDAQQARILQQMAHDLNVPTEVKILPTVREADGLAMSSRNRYLNPQQRQDAVVLIRSLQQIQELVAAGERNVQKLEAALTEPIRSTPGTRIDYACIVDAQNLQPISYVDRPALAAVAVFFGTTRLIDNILLIP